MTSKRHFTVNGTAREAVCGDEERLLDILRRHLGLTGTKEGCGIGQCGACTVLLDGRLVRSCLVRADRVDGAVVETIEGMEDGGNLHPLQEAFLAHNAMQCGYCTPGMLLTARALLEKEPVPDRDTIRQAIAGNLCRCTGYQQIIEAIQAGSEKPDSQEGDPK